MADGRAAAAHSSSVRTVLQILLRNKALRRVELAFASFNAAEWGTWLAMLVYAYSRGGVTASGILATAMLVPAALFAPLLAAAGERRPPGLMLAAGYAAQAATCAVVGLAMLADVRTPVVYALLVGPSIAYTMTRPMQAAFAPGLARRPEDLAAVNIVSSWVEGAATLVGPLLVGVVLAVSSPGAAFVLAAVVGAASVVFVFPLRREVPAMSPAGDESEGSFGGAIAFVREDANARTLVVLFGAQCIALGALDVLYVVLAHSILHEGSQWAGYLNAAFGAGAVLSFLVTARLVGHPRLARPLALSLGAWTVAFVGLSVVPGAAAALGLLALAGGARATFDVTGRMLLQRVARPGLLARVFGLLEGLEMVGLAIGTLLTPVIVWAVGPSAAFAVVALILPLIAATVGRRLLDIDRHATVPVVEIALLRSMEWFAALPAPTLEPLAQALVPSVVPAGVDVIVQGEEGDLFYVIADGEVEVIHDGILVTTLRRGDGFGEIALMHAVRRTATVRTITETHLHALDRETFLGALTAFPTSLATAEGLAAQRLEELRAIREAAG